MKKYSFKNDYSEWCHPNILQALSSINFEQQEWYWEDIYSIEARKLIQEKIWNKNSEIYFVSWWTQANLIVISSILKPYESVICIDTWHINTHEAWAIESTWHKVNYTNNKNWKITPNDIQEILDIHGKDHHMVKPKMVYISNSTEIWTIYSKKELNEISKICKKNNLFLFMDWARLGSALCSKENDLTLKDIAKLTDVFYIWWTKNWALLGEAIVINNENLSKDFLYNIKQKWWLLAKWSLLWIQFLELFKNDLFFDLAKHANNMAWKLNEAIKNKWFNFLTISTTNQIFPIFPNELIKKLSKNFEFYTWQKIDKNNSAVRLVTSWVTKEESVDEFIRELN